MKQIIPLILGILSFAAFSCEKTPEEIAVSSVSLSQPSAEMIIGETVQLKVSISPSNATDKNVIWGSSKQSVATVSDSGLVTAIAEGTSTVTASAGGKSATCTITVSKGTVEVTSIVLNKTALSLYKGESETLKVTIGPSDATDKTVTWISSDSSVASIDSNGKVTAIAKGAATITAKAGNIQATCEVTVTVPLESISINKTELSLNKGQSETLVVTIVPEDATERTIVWSTTNASVASINQNGLVTAISGGEATIKAKVGEKEATCVVKVTVPVESISLDKTSAELIEGESLSLVATVKPDDATDKMVSWASLNPNIATVSEGKITAIKEGETEVTASIGTIKATCHVSVKKPIIEVVTITINVPSVKIKIGKSVQLIASVAPDNATDKSVKWISSNDSIAKVDDTGLVTGIKEGVAVITAQSSKEGIKATCEVHVFDSDEGMGGSDMGYWQGEF